VKSQWCREHIDETAKQCGLDDKTVRETKQAAIFCEKHPILEPLATDTVLVIARMRSPVDQEAIIKKIGGSIRAGGRPTAETIRGLINGGEKKPPKSSNLETRPAPADSSGIPDKSGEVTPKSEDKPADSRPINPLTNEKKDLQKEDPVHWAIEELRGWLERYGEIEELAPIASMIWAFLEEVQVPA